MIRRWIVLLCSVAAAHCFACSSGPAENDVFDAVAQDLPSDNFVPGDGGDVIGDTGDEGPVDASDAENDAIPGDTADTMEPDAGLIALNGAFRFDYLATGAGLEAGFMTLGDGDRRAVAVNECGRMGTVFADRYQDNGFNASLVLSEIDLASPPDIDSLAPRRVLLNRTSSSKTPEMVASVVYDGCTAVVFVKTDTGYDFAVIGEGDVTWTTVDPARTYADILHFGAQVGRDDAIHLMFRARPNGGTTQWVDARFDGDSFNVRLLANPDAAMAAPIDVAFDSDGDAVIGYRKSVVAGQEAWIARWDGATWQKEQIPGVVPSELGASFAIGSYGREGLAWTATVESDDGLLLSAALKYTYRDTDDTFKTETVTVDNDGYLGSGTRFTGGRPVLTIDGTGRPHIVYSDLAVVTDGNSQTVSHGQLRYAWRRIDRWNYMTVFHQAAPDSDAWPYTGFREIAVNPDGTLAGAAAVAIVPDRFDDVTIETLGWSVSNAE